MKKYKLIVMVMFSTLLLTACTNERTKEKVTKKQNLFDVLSKQEEKIKVTESEDWNLPIIENQQYVFYTNTDKEIVRINKSNGNKQVIQKLKSTEYNTSGDVALELFKNKLLYIYDGCLYQSNFNGKNVRKIISTTKLKEMLNDVTFEMEGINVYDNKIYLIGGQEVLRLDTSENKAQVLARDVRTKPCFWQGNLYYSTREHTAIYGVNLDTLHTKIVRGVDENENKKDTIYYDELMVIKGQLFFERYQEKRKVDLMMFQKQKKDKKICSLDSVMSSINSKDTLLYKTKDGKKDQTVLELYDFKKKKSKEILLQSDFDFNYEVMLIDNVLLYSRTKTDGDRREYYEIKNIL
ncbi:MAG: hypothetical protein ACOX1S_11545 [Anaerostipes sp.]|nr:hypothetical protein [Anaerostipes sp.]